MKKITFIATVFCFILLNSCSSSKSVSNGSYSDLSLNIDSDKYEIERLKPIESSGKSLFGIPVKPSKSTGLVVRFNGVSLGKSNRLVPVLTILCNTAAMGYGLNQFGIQNSSIPEIAPAGAAVIAFPVALMLNNLIFSNSAVGVAASNFNSALVQNNSDIDIFLNPKYEIKNKLGLFGQEASITGKVMGAKIKTD